MPDQQRPTELHDAPAPLPAPHAANGAGSEPAPRDAARPASNHAPTANGAGPGHPSAVPSAPRSLRARVRGWRPSRGFWIRVALAAILIAVSVITNRQYVGWGLFVIFAIMIVPIGRARSFLLSFVPYAGVWFVFTALRSLADQTVLARTLNTKVSQLERWIFDGQLPSVLLQERLYDPSHLHWYDYLCTFTHWSYFIVPHVIAIRIWQKNPEFFRRYLRAMTLTLALGLAIYFLIPTNPPWMAPEAVNSPAAATVYRIMTAVGDQLGGGIYKASYKVIGESNPIAAMPSIHFAITFLLFFGVSLWGRRWQLVALAYAALMAFSLVYLGEHYVVDICVGGLITTYAWIATGTWIATSEPTKLGRFLARAPAPATAPPAPAGVGAAPGARP